MRRIGTAIFLMGLLPSVSWATEGSWKLLTDQNVGRTITLVGELSDILYQHMIHPLAGKETYYVDFKEGGQIVAYITPPVSCYGEIQLTGKLLRLTGGPKRPGAETKVGPDYTEYQIDVSEWRCLPFETQVKTLIKMLGDRHLTIEKKREIKQKIRAAGKEAIPLLIHSLNDARFFEKRDTQNYYNLPSHEPMPPPLMANLSVGDACREILYEIVTPPYSSPYAKNIKPFSFSLFSIRDWPGWWERHKDKTLQEIHEEMRPTIDRYWQQHGTEQVIP